MYELTTENRAPGEGHPPVQPPNDTNTRVVILPAGTRASDAKEIAAGLVEFHPGYYLSKFEPHLGRALLSRMTFDEHRVRETLATKLGVGPWDVQIISGDSTAGYAFTLSADVLRDVAAG